MLLFKGIVAVILILNIIIVLSDKTARFEKGKKSYVGRSELNGVYNKEKFDEPTTFKPNKEKESKDKVKNKINFREVDSDGNEYMTEIDEDEIDAIISRSLSLITEGSTKPENEKQDGNNEKEDEKDEKDRRLIILGSDTRYEITSATYTPVKETGLLTFSGGSCSAALIGPRTVLTAGHCVHEGDGGSWYNNFRFYPSRTSTFASTGYYWSRAFTFQGWSNDGDYDWDIALVELSVSPNKGWLSMGYDGGIDDTWYFYSKGYPGDKPYGSMWSTGDYISDANTNTLETDDSDTYDGHSGAPWYAYPSYLTYPRIFAAHSGSGWWFGSYNRHTRITSTKFSAFCTWINNPSLC